MKIRCVIATLLLVATPVWFGCEVKPGSNDGSVSKSGTGSHSHDGHSHDGHDHGHGDEHGHGGHDHPEHGPNGGHVVHFDTSPTTHFEWAHDDEKQTLTVYFEELVKGGAKIESVEIQVTSDGSEKKFTLAADEQAKVAGSVYQIKDQELLTLVGASGSDPKGVQAKMYVTIDGKEESLLLKDDHHHH